MIVVLFWAAPAGAVTARHPSTPSPRRTADSTSPQAKLATVQRRLAAQRRQLAQTRAAEHEALVQLTSAQDRLDRAQRTLTQTTGALTGTRRAVDGATRALRDVSTRLQVHEALMDSRLRASYERGSLGYLDVVLGATTFQDFISRAYLLGVILNGDLALDHQIGTERRQRAEVRQTLAAREQLLARLQEQWRVSRDEVARLTAARRDVAARIGAQVREQEEQVRELEQESLRISEILERASHGAFTGPVPTLAGGALRWPVVGRISSPFGWRIHPIFGTREFHTGIDIAVPWGTPIEAAAAGTVVYTGWMRGYGMLVILDHGHGLSTTYSHLSSYAVHIGEHVARGQMIARVGSTGWSTGPHLLFEVRQNGQPVNPLGN